MRFTSASFATSPTAASARPPRRSIIATVSLAALASMSATTTEAPSFAKRSAPSRPCPIPAPVMNATFPASRMSDPLEVPLQLPARDHLVEGLELEPRRVQVVLVDFLAEGFASHLALLERRHRLAQRARHLRQAAVLVRVAVVEGRRLELLVDAMEPRRDGRGEGQV